MHNLFKMYLYKIRHSKATLVMLLIALGMTLFTRAVTKAVEVMIEKWESTQEETEAGAEDTMEITVDSHEENETIVDSYVTQLKGGLCLLFMVIYAGIVFGADERQGFMKNIAVQVPKRWKIVGARIAATAVVLVIFLAISFLWEILMDLIFSPGIPFGAKPDVLIAIGLEFLLHMAFLSLTIFLITWWRNAGLYMPISILLATGFHSLFANLFNALITALKGELVFDVNWLFSIIQVETLPVHGGGSDWVFAGVLAIVYLIVWNGLNILMIRKRDIV